MSQRQLALQSGVDHSTISRLIKGDRMPSLGTATKLARGLREITDEADGPAYFASLNSRAVLPTTRVEYALRGDDSLTEADVRELMQAYIAVRRARDPQRRQRRTRRQRLTCARSGPGARTIARRTSGSFGTPSAAASGSSTCAIAQQPRAAHVHGVPAFVHTRRLHDERGRSRAAARAARRQVHGADASPRRRARADRSASRARARVVEVDHRQAVDANQLFEPIDHAVAPSTSEMS